MHLLRGVFYAIRDGNASPDAATLADMAPMIEGEYTAPAPSPDESPLFGMEAIIPARGEVNIKTSHMRRCIPTRLLAMSGTGSRDQIVVTGVIVGVEPLFHRPEEKRPLAEVNKRGFRKVVLDVGMDFVVALRNESDEKVIFALDVRGLLTPFSELGGSC